MTDSSRPAPAYDPFGEPMDVPCACTDARGYGETRRAAFLFWVLALLFVAGRIYLSDWMPSPIVTSEARGIVQISTLP